MLKSEINFLESDGFVKNQIKFFKTDDQPVFKNIVLNNSARITKSISYLFRDIFLPEGYPDSVHSDYIPFQVWNAIQALASTITGTLTTSQVLKGVGVGDKEATEISAAITWTLRDGMGHVSRILFVWWQGVNLDAQSKKWRLFADILNDFAMGIELAVPLFPSYAMITLCTTSAMKAIVGLAGGATRVALKQHQALRKNLGDLFAKEGSQETAINLIGSLIGVLILLFIPNKYFVYLFILLTFIHLFANYAAIKCLEMNSLNEERLCIVIRDYLLYHTISDPKSVNKRESLFSWTKPAKRMFGFNIEIGTSFEQVVKRNLIDISDVPLLLSLFQRRKYLTVMDIKRRTMYLILSKEISEETILGGYFHCCIHAMIICNALKIKNEVFDYKVFSPPSYPLMRIILFPDNHTLAITKKSKLTAEIADAIDEVTHKEYFLFQKLLEESKWINKSDLLPVKCWRASWE